MTDSSALFLPVRCDGSGLLHGHLVQSRYLQGDQVHGARADSSIPTHTLQRRLGCKVVLDSSVLSPVICVRLCCQCASSFT